MCAVSCQPQAAIDALYKKIEADEHKRAHEKQHKPAPAKVSAPAGAATGPALATA